MSLFKGSQVCAEHAVEWPPRSPDLTPCDFWLWGYLKSKVYDPMPATLQDLRNSIMRECGQIPQHMVANSVQAMYDRARVCVQRRGAVVEGRA